MLQAEGISSSFDVDDRGLHRGNPLHPWLRIKETDGQLSWPNPQYLRSSCDLSTDYVENFICRILLNVVILHHGKELVTSVNSHITNSV